MPTVALTHRTQKLKKPLGARKRTNLLPACPQGYLSQVGERGCRLSVGQRQRIGIARAFLKDAPILLLDEPTSALDPITEASLMATILELMKGRTTLMVTHRIRTVHHLARIVVLSGGRIVEEGRGSELLKAEGLYSRLYRSTEATLDSRQRPAVT